MLGAKVGERRTFTLEPERAYGHVRKPTSPRSLVLTSRPSKPKCRSKLE